MSSRTSRSKAPSRMSNSSEELSCRCGTAPSAPRALTDAVAPQCATGGAAVGQEDVPDELEMFSVIAAHEDRRERVDGGRGVEDMVPGLL